MAVGRVGSLFAWGVPGAPTKGCQLDPIKVAEGDTERTL